MRCSPRATSGSAVASAAASMAVGGGLLVSLLVPASAVAAADCDTGPTHSIAEVQGPGDTTPLEGEDVRVEGVVTGDFLAADRLRGFFIQSTEPDDDPSTSEGLFVFAPGRDLEAGDRVLVSGEAVEFFGLTELTRVSAVDVCGEREIAPTEVTLPLDAGDFEPLEGMLLTFPQTLTATETFNVARFGEISVSAGGRLFQPTDGHGDTQDGNDARRMLIDDGSTRQNRRPVPYLPVRLGDTARNVTGVMSYGFDSYRLQPTEPLEFTPVNRRPRTPEDVGGNVKVAAFNTLNWFTTLGERGARTEEEQERQLAKLVAALKGLDADVIGLMEIENNDKALRVLVEALNDEVRDDYAEVEHPGPGVDAIQVAMIYRPSKVRPSGDPITSEDEIFSRPPLMQKFKRTRSGEPFTAVVNHFKSKGCGGAEGDDRDQGDGQGCYNATRVGQARALMDAMADVPKPLVIGDLNSYADEDPIKEFASGGHASMTRRHVENDDRYSFVFFGQAGELDHALAGRALAKRVTGTTIWHINSDEPRVLDYHDAELSEPDAFRSSDHDPIIVGLKLRGGRH